MDSTTKLLLHFDEPTALQPTDAAGNLDDLTTEPGIVKPTTVETWSGFGRRFVRATLHALLAADLTGRDTLLQKDATVQWLGSLTLTGAAGPHTVIARGLNDGSIAERYSLGLEIEEQALYPGFVEMRLFWQDSAGVIKTQAPGVFKHPGDGKEILFTATRRWEATGKVVIRYYVNDEMIAELVSVDGDISGGTTARTTIGARKAAGAWGRFLNGTIDELLVTDFEMSPEEVHHTFRRMTDYQPGGVETYAGLSPVGLDWYKNPSSSIGKLVKITGLALGFTVALIEELLLMWLPDKAPLKHIARWERLCGLSAKPRDSLDVRRARVVSYLQREEGFSHSAIQAALATVLDVAALADIQLLEFTNEIRDDFATLNTNRWLAGDVAGTWTLVAGQARLAVPLGAIIGWTSSRYPVHLRTSLDTGGGKIYLAAKLASWGALPASCGVGIYLHDRRKNNLLWFGVYNDAGVHKIGYRQVTADTEGAFVAIVNAPGAGPAWLRIHMKDDLTTYRLQYSTIGASAGFVTTELAIGALSFDWGGFLAIGPIGATAAAIAADFDDFVAFCRDGVLPFHWYAYRPTALGGEPDMNGGRLLTKKIKPAHTYGAAIDGLQLICDNQVSGVCDRGPLGS